MSTQKNQSLFNHKHQKSNIFSDTCPFTLFEMMHFNTNSKIQRINRSEVYVPRKYSSLDSSIFCLLDSNGMAHLLYCRLGHRCEFFLFEISVWIFGLFFNKFLRIFKATSTLSCLSFQCAVRSGLNLQFSVFSWMSPAFSAGWSATSVSVKFNTFKCAAQIFHKFGNWTSWGFY